MIPGTKFDSGKLPLDLLPWRALLSVAAVLAYGAAKYPEPRNWQKVRPRSRYFAACLRHLIARVLGEKLDAESGLPHLAHATCCVLFLLSWDVGLDLADPFGDSEGDGSNVIQDATDLGKNVG